MDVNTMEPAAWSANPAKEWCPPGHGDLYAALSGSGKLDEVRDTAVVVAVGVVVVVSCCPILLLLLSCRCGCWDRGRTNMTRTDASALRGGLGRENGGERGTERKQKADCHGKSLMDYVSDDGLFRV